MTGGTKYGDLALLMRTLIGFWLAVEHGITLKHNDRNALSPILCVVPSEMLRALAVKNSPKEAWDAVTAMRMCIEHVRKVKVLRLRAKFKMMTFQEG